MSAQQKLDEKKAEIVGLEKTLEKLREVLTQTKVRHAEELKTSEEEINKAATKIESQREAVELAEELNQEYEEARREELKYFLVLRAAIEAGTATVDDCDTYALEVGFEIEPETKEEAPPMLSQTA
jgi:Fic family protein